MKRCTDCGKTKGVSAFYRGRSDCKDCKRAEVRRYKAKYPERADQHRGPVRARRIRLCKVHPECATIDRQEVLRRGKGICGICGKKVRPKWHMDHIIPVSKKGTHCYYNLQPSHVKCNLRKGNSVRTG